MSKTNDQESKIEFVELPQSGNGFLRFTACTLIFAFLFAGCEQLEVETLSVSSDYATQAIEAKTRIRKPGEIFTNSIGMKLVRIGAGSFMMGSSHSAAQLAREYGIKEVHFKGEFPQHQVRISKGFWMSQTEVTQGQYESVMNAQPWSGEDFVQEDANNPAVYVTWKDAAAFCRKLSQQEGKMYRLPTEAEWEYACRAGTTTRFSFGDSDSSLGDYAWCRSNAEKVGQKYAHSVGQKKPNPWGLYDMHGNVGEWCSDWYDKDYYSNSPSVDPKGPSDGNGRCLRGGSWSGFEYALRCSYRLSVNPAGRSYVVGFRVSQQAIPAAENAFEVEVRTDVKIPMRDGIELSANIFLPKSKGKFPVILVRSPYGKGGEKYGDGLFYADRGYVLVSQDCRGKGASQGKWEPFANEADDGRDTQKWLLEQPWCNGSIGTSGGSYVGFTQWISAPNAGEHLKAMFPVVPLVDTYGDGVYTDGALNLALMMGWGSLMSFRPGEQVAMLGWNEGDWNKAFRTLPLGEWDRAIGRKVQYLRDWVAHPHFDEYWAARGVRNRWQDITVPICVVGGWYDIFARSVFEHINAVRSMSRSQHARKHQYLLMGPWGHGISQDGKVGDLDFGRESVVNLREIQTKWFDYWLKGEQTGADTWPAYRIFVMGRNLWRDEHEWPLKRTKYTPYYFHSEGSANTLKGDGRLSRVMPDNESFDRFVYDPNDPVPTLGGCNLFGCPAGPWDQTRAERRKDVLVFTSDELKTDLEVTGPVKVILYAASSACNTDWTAKLVDVHPDGRPFNLCDGIMRACYRESNQNPTLIQPKKIYCYEIDLWVTSNVFLPGHKMRVEISSSNFPRFDRNLNTGVPFGTGTELIKATQTVYHDMEHPSHILLPVIP